MSHSFKLVFLTIFSIVIFLTPLETSALTHKWIKVPMSEYGEQVWDKKSIIRNDDGSIRVLSKFIPKTSNDITEDILYTMEINCFEKTFRDIGLGSKEFDEYENIKAVWKYPNGDKLLLGVIDQVCDFKD